MFLSLNFFPAPPNDNFANATPIFLGQSLPSDNTASRVESGEPTPSCVFPEYYGKTIWFSFTPISDVAVTAASNANWTFISVYTGSELGNLTGFGCRTGQYPLPMNVEAGTTYYFQVGSLDSYDARQLTFQLYNTPPSTADFSWSPGDPNIYENVQFCDDLSDPVYLGFAEFVWDFGDGTVAANECVYHNYAADGDYIVWHNVQTIDSRTDPDGVVHTVSVRTHDVAVTRVSAPTSARVGQTRQITVYIKNNLYPERVEVQLQKSVPWGYK